MKNKLHPYYCLSGPRPRRNPWKALILIAIGVIFIALALAILTLAMP